MNIDKIKGLIPVSIFDEIPAVVRLFNIDTPLRLAHFLSQCHHESSGFLVFRENLNYSRDGLLKTFKKYFTLLTATQYARQPERIANKVYANRMGNGPENSGDGWRFRGAGAIQLTGKDNFIAFDRFVPDDIISNPELVEKKYPLTSAAWFWSVNNLNNKADLGSEIKVVTSITKTVNNGLNGISDRIMWFNKFYALLK